MLDAYEGPSSWMVRLASHLPMSMLSSRDLPWTIPAVKPPAKASLENRQGENSLQRTKYTYPAPLVSMMLSLEISLMGHSLTSTSPLGFTEAVTVGKVP